MEGTVNARERERERERESIFLDVARVVLRGISLGWSDARIAREADVDVDVIPHVRGRLAADPRLVKRVRTAKATEQPAEACAD